MESILTQWPKRKNKENKPDNNYWELSALRDLSWNRNDTYIHIQYDIQREDTEIKYTTQRVNDGKI